MLIGNEVRNQAIIKENGKETIITGSFSGYDDKQPNNTTANSNNLDSLKLVGDKVALVLDNVIATSGDKVTINASNVEVSQSTSDIVLDKNLLNSVIIDNTGTLDSSSIDKYASIKDITDWYYFANGWNNNQNSMTYIRNFKLMNDIDFGSGQTIQNVGIFNGNYADPNGDGNYDDAMIVGGVILADAAFTANFDGGGNVMRNVSMNIDIDTHSNLLAGIFGMTKEADIYNLAIKDINISLSNDMDNYFEMGSLIGYAKDTKIYDIKIMNVEMNSKTNNNNGSGQVMVGGFVGWLQSSNIRLNSVCGIIVNNVEIDIEYYSASPQLRVGSFVGFLKDVNISDVIFSGIIDLHTNIYKSGVGVVTPGGSFNYTGGFIGELSGKNYFSNIYLYFNSNSILHSNDKNNSVAKFGHAAGPYDQTFFNVNLYYNFDTTNPNSIANLPHSEDYYNQTINPSIPAQDKINLYTYTNSINKRDEFNAKIKQTFGDNIVILGNDIEGWNYHFNPPLNNPALPTLDMDNLFNKGGYFDSSSWLTKDDFNQSILNEILENLSFDILSLITDTNSLESALQSLDFLLHFINADKSGESGISLGNGIYGLMGYTLNQSQIDLLNSNNLLITQKLISSINSLSLEDKHYIQEYKQKLESYQAKAKEFEESLKVISSDKHQALIEAFKQENGYYSLLDDRDRAEKIIKTAINNNGEFNLNNPYKIANGINVSFNLNTIEGINDKDGLNPDFTLPSANSSLFVKENIEDVLILPAQEKQEAIVEDGKERGRLCIVSDNAKTNNPCMAITY